MEYQTLLYETEGPGSTVARRAWARIADWCAAAGAARAVRSARFGFLGHTYPGMLDMYSDFTRVHGQLGAHVEAEPEVFRGVRIVLAHHGGHGPG